VSTYIMCKVATSIPSVQL